MECGESRWDSGKGGRFGGGKRRNEALGAALLRVGWFGAQFAVIGKGWTDHQWLVTAIRGFKARHTHPRGYMCLFLYPAPDASPGPAATAERSSIAMVVVVVDATWAIGGLSQARRRRQSPASSAADESEQTATPRCASI
jgi:hypothetical protein